MKSEFGLIGRKLSHSFSKKYFEDKFELLGLSDHFYHLFEIGSVSEIKSILTDYPHLKGLNVTIPYKKDVMDILDEIDGNAERIGSVNVIKITGSRKLKGFNTDYYGFRESLMKWMGPEKISESSALVLGSGGASKAVCTVFEDLNIPYLIVSRNMDTGNLSYNDLDNDPGQIRNHNLIINTTPLGMFPLIENCPPINYSRIDSSHWCLDLVYNPVETLFLNKANEKGARVKNGLEMLHLQAEKSWEIWTQ